MCKNSLLISTYAILLACCVARSHSERQNRMAISMGDSLFSDDGRTYVPRTLRELDQGIYAWDGSKQMNNVARDHFGNVLGGSDTGPSKDLDLEHQLASLKSVSRVVNRPQNSDAATTSLHNKYANERDAKGSEKSIGRIQEKKTKLLDSDVATTTEGIGFSTMFDGDEDSHRENSLRDKTSGGSTFSSDKPRKLKNQEYKPESWNQDLDNNLVTGDSSGYGQPVDFNWNSVSESTQTEKNNVGDSRKTKGHQIFGKNEKLPLTEQSRISGSMSNVMRSKSKTTLHTKPKTARKMGRHEVSTGKGEGSSRDSYRFVRKLHAVVKKKGGKQPKQMPPTLSYTTSARNNSRKTKRSVVSVQEGLKAKKRGRRLKFPYSGEPSGHGEETDMASLWRIARGTKKGKTIKPGGPYELFPNVQKPTIEQIENYPSYTPHPSHNRNQATAYNVSSKIPDTYFQSGRLSIEVYSGVLSKTKAEGISHLLGLDSHVIGDMSLHFQETNGGPETRYVGIIERFAKSMYELIQSQISTESCQRLDPTLESYLGRLIGRHNIMREPEHHREIPFLFHNPRYRTGWRRPDIDSDPLFFENWSDTFPIDADSLRSKITMLKQLIAEYNRLSQDQQVRVESIYDYLQATLNYLTRMLNSPIYSQNQDVRFGGGVGAGIASGSGNMYAQNVSQPQPVVESQPVNVTVQRVEVVDTDYLDEEKGNSEQDEPIIPDNDAPNTSVTLSTETEGRHGQFPETKQQGDTAETHRQYVQSEMQPIWKEEVNPVVTKVALDQRGMDNSEQVKTVLYNGESHLTPHAELHVDGREQIYPNEEVHNKEARVYPETGEEEHGYSGLSSPEKENQAAKMAFEEGRHEMDPNIPNVHDKLNEGVNPGLTKAGLDPNDPHHSERLNMAHYDGEYHPVPHHEQHADGNKHMYPDEKEHNQETRVYPDIDQEEREYNELSRSENENQVAKTVSEEGLREMDPNIPNVHYKLNEGVNPGLTKDPNDPYRSERLNVAHYDGEYHPATHDKQHADGKKHMYPDEEMHNQEARVYPEIGEEEEGHGELPRPEKENQAAESSVDGGLHEMQPIGIDPILKKVAVDQSSPHSPGALKMVHDQHPALHNEQNTDKNEYIYPDLQDDNKEARVYPEIPGERQEHSELARQEKENELAGDSVLGGLREMQPLGIDPILSKVGLDRAGPYSSEPLNMVHYDAEHHPNDEQKPDEEGYVSSDAGGRNRDLRVYSENGRKENRYYGISKLVNDEESAEVPILHGQRRMHLKFPNIHDNWEKEHHPYPLNQDMEEIDPERPQLEVSPGPHKERTTPHRRGAGHRKARHVRRHSRNTWPKDEYLRLRQRMNRMMELRH